MLETPTMAVFVLPTSARPGGVVRALAYGLERLDPAMRFRLRCVSPRCSTVVYLGDVPPPSGGQTRRDLSLPLGLGPPNYRLEVVSWPAETTDR